MTITITEAGYLRGADEALQADVDALRADPAAPVRTAPARIVAGLAARRRADAGPITLVPCDNLPENGAVVARVVGELADRVEPGLRDWLEASVATVTTMVDRITPRTTEEDSRRTTGPGDHRTVQRMGAQRRFPRRAAALGGRRSHVHRRHRAVRGAQAVAAQRRPFAVGLRRIGTGARDGRRSRGRRHLPRVAGGVVGGGVAPAHAAGGRPRALSHHPARALLEPADAPPAGPDRRRRLAEAPGPILPVLRTERASGRMPDGAVRVLAAWNGHLRGAGRRSPTHARTNWSHSPPARRVCAASSRPSTPRWPRTTRS